MKIKNILIVILTLCYYTIHPQSITEIKAIKEFKVIDQNDLVLGLPIETPVEHVPDFSFKYDINSVLFAHNLVKRAYEQRLNKWYERQERIIKEEIEDNFNKRFRDLGQARKYMYQHYESRNVYPNVKKSIDKYGGVISGKLKKQDGYLKNIRLYDLKASLLDVGVSPSSYDHIEINGKPLRDIKNTSELRPLKNAEINKFNTNNYSLKLSQSIRDKMKEISNSEIFGGFNHHIFEELFVKQRVHQGSFQRWEQLDFMQIHINNIPRRLPDPNIVLISARIFPKDFGTPAFIEDYATRRHGGLISRDNYQILLKSISLNNALLEGAFNTLDPRLKEYLDANYKLKDEVARHFKAKDYNSRSVELINALLSSALDGTKFDDINTSYYSADTNASINTQIEGSKDLLIEFRMKYQARRGLLINFPEILFELFKNNKHVISEGGIIREIMTRNGMNVPSYLSDKWLGLAFEFKDIRHLYDRLNISYANGNGTYLWDNGVKDYQAHLKFIDDLSNKLNITDNDLKSYLFANGKKAIEYNNFLNRNSNSADAINFVNGQIELGFIDQELKFKFKRQSGRLNNRIDQEYTHVAINNQYTMYQMTDGSRVLRSPNELILNSNSVFTKKFTSEGGNENYWYIKLPESENWANYLLKENISTADELRIMFDLGGIGFAKVLGSYVFPFEDIKILIDGKDFDGQQVARWKAAGFILLAIVPGGKTIKIVGKITAQSSKWGKLILINGRFVRYTHKVVNGIVDFGVYNSKKFRKGLNILNDASKQAHHVISRNLKTHRTIQKAARYEVNPFHIDEILNGIPVATWRNQPNHSLYDGRIRSLLDNISVNLSPEDTLKELENIISKMKQIIKDNPNVHLNDLIF